MVIKNIIFDLGNVLLSYEPEVFLLRFTKDLTRIKQFLSKIPRSTTWWQLDRGVMSTTEAKNILINKFPEEKDLVEPYFEHWMEMLTPIEKNIEILKDLKQHGYKLYILSNFIKEAFEYVTNKYDFFSFFDGQVISYIEKVIKPEKAIYDTLIQRYHLIAEESVFLDDIFGFLKPAKKLGMHTILINSNKDLRRDLKKIGVDI
jgi:putative hydrolase of the HAD superfamily